MNNTKFNMLNLKMLCLYLLSRNIFNYTSEGHYKLEKLPIIIHECSNITENTCGPQIGLYYFTFRLIKLKQLDSLTPINTFSCLCGLEVTHDAMGSAVLGSISGVYRDVYVFFVVLLLLCLNLLALTIFLS